MSRSFRSACATVIVLVAGGMLAAQASAAGAPRAAAASPTDISSAQRGNQQQQSIGRGFSHARPMRAAPRAQVVQPRMHAPRLHAPRLHVPRLHVPRVHVPRVEAPRMHAPRVRMQPRQAPVYAPQRPAVEPVNRPRSAARRPPAAVIQGPRVIHVPAPNLGSVRPRRLGTGVPTPQLRQGMRVPNRATPAPNLRDRRQPETNQARSKPGRGPITGFVGVHRRHVAIHRGQRFLRHDGRWHRVVAVTALTGVVAVIVVGGASYFADGYLDLPPYACGGTTDAGCQLTMADVPASDGETVPQCVQYCPWLAASAPPVAAASSEVAEPVTRIPAEPAPEPPAAPTGEVAAVPADVAPDAAQSYAIVLQSAPDAGGKCADVPEQQFMQGMALQLWSCNGTAAQTFTYDTGKKSLAIGGFCIDAGGEAAEPGDALRLSPCNGAASQTWYIRQNGADVEFVGNGEVCMDVKDAATDDGTPLIAWPCHGQANQSWTMRPAAQAAAAK